MMTFVAGQNIAGNYPLLIKHSVSFPVCRTSRLSVSIPLGETSLCYQQENTKIFYFCQEKIIQTFAVTCSLS